jgi:hypothetical protein
LTVWAALGSIPGFAMSALSMTKPFPSAACLAAGLLALAGAQAQSSLPSGSL